MSDAVPPLSADTTPAHLFVDNGVSVKFYVDPGSVPGRPKLIRTLKSAGASITSDPMAADYLLVQSHSDTGQRFVRDWNADKTILEVSWISRSMSAGKLLKGPDWGGCLAVVDPSQTFDQEEPDDNPLPTPRITPVGSHTFRSQEGGSRQPNVHQPPETAHFSQPLGRNGHLPNNYSLPVHFQPPPLLQPQPQFSYSQPGLQQQPQLAIQPSFMSDPQAQAYISSLMDICRNQVWAQASGMSNGIQPGYFGPPGLNPGMMLPPVMHSQPPGMLPPHRNQMSHSPSPMLESLPPSFRRKSPEVSRSMGKRKASSLYDHSSDPAADSSTSAKRIFTSDDGPLTFHVQIEVQKRQEVVNHIKKNGGQISADIKADYVILNSSSKIFNGLLETVLADGQAMAVKSAFVFDSVADNTLLDASPYQFPPPPQKAKKPNSSSPTKTDAEKKQAARERKAKSRRVQKSTVKAERVTPDSRAPSPSPPPEHTRLKSGEHFRYTDVEYEYALRYATILFERDHQTSFTALATKLHVKMPHHSSKAWGQYLTHKIRSDIENIKKKAGIAYRKAHPVGQSQADKPPLKRLRLSPPSATPPPAEEGEEQEDLNIIVQFFMNDADETENEDEEQSARDARVWARLTSQVACKTEKSWEIFYNKHYDRVNDALEPQDERAKPDTP